MRHPASLLLTLSAILALACPPAALTGQGAGAPAGEGGPLDAVAWLGGCWTFSAGGSTTLEMWLPPAGGLMVGASRTVMGARSPAWEHLRIRAEGAGLVYTAIPSGQAETDFRSTSVSGTGFTVENPDHDFPQRITYHRTGPDAFRARVEAEGEDGWDGFEVAFHRVPCEASR